MYSESISVSPDGYRYVSKEHMSRAREVWYGTPASRLDELPIPGRVGEIQCTFNSWQGRGIVGQEPMLIRPLKKMITVRDVGGPLCAYASRLLFGSGRICSSSPLAVVYASVSMVDSGDGIVASAIQEQEKHAKMFEQYP